jgi:predicted GTPase
MIIDTPGLGDSEKRDSSNLPQMVKSLKAVGYIHTFVFVINSQDTRFNQQLQEAIGLFREIFGENMFPNVLICFTKFA